MHRHALSLSETGDMASSRSSRAPSFTSDRPSVASSVTFQMPSTVRPPPAYIAASVASQTVTDHHNAQLRQQDADVEELDNAVFSEPALALLNAFLDHLLFAFLSSARSPSLTAIRPAIADVLKPRLAREAMEAADEELQGLLAGDDDEDLPAYLGKKWEVEKMWKRTRLRIMVYTRLGELEDEDEDRYVQQERGLSMDQDDDDEAGLVSWAAAIFLTSVIEYVAEQTLLLSGSAAYARMAAKVKKLALQSDDAPDLSFERLIIEEPDVEKIALNSALGRLWRTWRKRVRTPLSPSSPARAVRPTSSSSNFYNRKASYDTISGSIRSDRSPVLEHSPSETDIAANIPLPLGDNDVNEIEVPGLARTYEQDAESSGTQTPVPRHERPSSVIMLSQAATFRRRGNKERPISMPLRPAPTFTVPPRSSTEEAETPFQTSMEQPDHQDDYFDAEEQDAVPARKDVAERRLEDSPEPDAEMVAFAASTGMGFRMSTAGPVPAHVSNQADSDAEIPSAADYESEHKVLQSKRMSIEKTGRGVVRTFSTRSSSLKSPLPTPTATPKIAQHPEGSSYLELSDEEADAPQAIGVARTSDVPIRSTPTPPGESPVDTGKGAAHGGFVEVHPRHSAPTSVPFRNTPTPDAKPIVPERSVARKDVHSRSSSGNEIASGPNQYEGTPSPPRRQDAPPQKSRGSSLPPLQEVDSITNKPTERLGSESVAHRSNPTSGSSMRSSPYPDHDAPGHVAERGAQRSSTDDSTRPQPGRSDRSHSDKASLKRATSSASSTKISGSFTVTPSGRSSEASQRPRNLSGRMSEEDREREFDTLVKGKDTVKFTLTPQNMRNLDPSRPRTSSVTVYPRVDADKDASFGTKNLPKRTASRGTGPTTPQHKPSPSRKVVSRQLAREPRIESESMRDFADFIRSTGPSPGQEKSVQPFVNISGNGSKASNASTSSLGRKFSTRQINLNTRNKESPSATQRNMEPRSPAGLTAGNDDLIDFIRQGPPNANSGEPRIPRNVAPFRSTVDSDQFDTMLGTHGNVESAFDSTSSTLDSKHSAQTINSRTGLLPTPKVVQPAYSNTPQNLSGSMASNPEPVITKTRRRIKDPYAIDSSEDEDEDEDQLTALPYSSQPARPRQESLMDFLNDMDPPSTSKPQPFMLSEETIAAARARANVSNSSLASSNTATRNGNGSMPFGAMSSNSVASDTTRGSKPRQYARVPSAGDVRGGAGKTATSDLADFLKNSGPPEPMVRPGQGAGPKKEEEKKSRKFWRTKKTYANTPHSPALPHQLPQAVFLPHSTQETSTILKACHDRRVAVSSFSGGTSLGGALACVRGGVCVSFEQMKEIVELHEDDLDVVVQPGLGWVELNRALEGRGVWFPVDPAPGASVGGMIAMSCSGTNAYRYGTMKEWVISLTYVLADGSIVKTHRRPRKSSAGYDLTHLIIGSEGTLGLVTEAVLRLAPLPKNLHVGLATFPSFKHGVDIVVALQKSGHQLEALELADGPQMHCINHSQLAPQFFPEVPTLFLKFAGPSAQLVQDQIRVVEALCKQLDALSFEITAEKTRIDVLWGARKCMGHALVAMKKDPSDLFLNTDCAVPISQLAALVDGTQALIQKANAAENRRDWFCANVGHIGDGNVHSSIVCPAADRVAAEAVLRQVASLALRLDGTVTGEHGVGLKLREALEEEVGKVGVDVMRRVKRSLDERGILNPDKVFRLDGDGGDGEEMAAEM
ncbi:uncharacterized protein K460DRAFT_336854 [Cucurbitaria berberidis CBS 394.84]|uniref:FAD-binding PCMH-type domain-containing protein n=1 Tax=Cucurbitaria berberidis CBS 394.84 TaxID=1168544 RepID=A0A9P4GG72_9PLEO|nr:uncharacterized protein K460DRAFT_336854 [Cucurbitaria berberidis CBS 394.84]KAF1845042.1 hypothetical protein K460DRAFT_336854 [Cucurbitaria berberidis CBS 394.84]